MRVRSGETPGSPVAGSRYRARSRCRSGATTPRGGGGDWPVRSMKRSLQRRHGAPARCVRDKREPSPLPMGEGQGRRLWSWSERRRTLRRKGAWNGQTVVLGTGEALLDPGLRAREAGLPITGTGKWQVVERDSEGVVVVVTVGTTQPGSSEGPLLHRCTTKEWRDSDECRAIG